MDLLKERILKSGKVIGDDVLKVDSFLNQQIDVGLLHAIGEEFHRLFQDCQINKILTIESSGIGIACATAQLFSVPVVFAKKGTNRSMSTDVYSTEIYSFTKETAFTVSVDKEYLTNKDKILIIDDFLANGKAVLGLMNLMSQAGSKLEGVGVVIEKGFQDGGKILREMGVRLESLAIVKSIGDGKIVLE